MMQYAENIFECLNKEVIVNYIWRLISDYLYHCFEDLSEESCSSSYLTLWLFLSRISLARSSTVMASTTIYSGVATKFKSEYKYQLPKRTNEAPAANTGMTKSNLVSFG